MNPGLSGLNHGHTIARMRRTSIRIVAMGRKVDHMLTKKQFLEKKEALLDEVLKRLSDVEEMLDKLEQLEVDNTSTPDLDSLAVGDLVADAYEAAEHLRDSTRTASKGAGP